MLARQGRAGALVRVWVPTAQQEQVRGVVRFREAVVRDVVAAKQRLLKFLSLRGMVYREKGSHWTQRHMQWLRGLHFEGVDAWTAEQLMGDLRYRLDRLREAERQVSQLAQVDPYAELVGRVCCFRGLDVVSGMVVVTETLDFRRFAEAGQYMSYWGLTCCEDSSGPTRRRGSITKCGSARARRVWVEAAWHYRHKPAVGERLRRRQQGQPAEVIAHAWKAQRRLHDRFWRLTFRKGTQTAVVAVARELTGFVWGAMQL
jgi:transposase